MGRIRKTSLTTILMNGILHGHQTVNGLPLLPVGMGTEIYVMNADGKNQKNTTQGPFSHDGRPHGLRTVMGGQHYLPHLDGLIVWPWAQGKNLRDGCRWEESELETSSTNDKPI